MTANKTKTKNVNLENEDVKKLTVRQFFYSKKRYDENLIKSLERSYKEELKTEEEWLKIMSFKNITF